MYMQMYVYSMSKAYSVADARAHLPEILDEVEGGKDVHLSRRGHPVAVVLSTSRYEVLRGNRPKFSDLYRDFVARNDLAKLGIDPEFSQSLRDRRPGRRVRV